MSLTSSHITLDVPPNACDCHMHVFGPTDQFPGKPGHSYLPSPASLAQWQSSFDSLGIARVVVVQPSCYGTDNRCTVQAITELEGRARGVSSIAPDIGEAGLFALHRAGMRAVRINAKSVGLSDPILLRKHIAEVAEKIAVLGWHIQMYADLSAVTALAEVIRSAPCPVVLDHMGGARAGQSDDELSVLYDLLRDGNCWAKLSGAYRVARQGEDCSDTVPIAQALLKANPDNIVWGSDWPHTSEHAGKPEEKPLPIAFRHVVPASLLQLLARQCGEQKLFNRVLADNAARLYAF